MKQIVKEGCNGLIHSTWFEIGDKLPYSTYFECKNRHFNPVCKVKDVQCFNPSHTTSTFMAQENVLKNSM